MGRQFFFFVESPVPLEFTPVLGILIGVVVTLLLVAFVIMLILRMKYKTSKRMQQQQRRGSSTNSNNGQSRNDPDAEEYFCLKPSSDNNSSSKPTVVATAAQNSHQNSARNHKVNGGHHQLRPTLGAIEDHNPDLIPGKLQRIKEEELFIHHIFLGVHHVESESLRSGTPVKSDISGTGSVSGYGTGGDSGSDKTPPYLPTCRSPNYATLGHHYSLHQQPRGICNPMENHHVTYAQLTLPSASSPRGQQRHHHQPFSDKVIYSQIDMSRKSSNRGGAAGNVTVNPYPSDDPLSWAPLLGNRNQPESSL